MKQSLRQSILIVVLIVLSFEYFYFTKAVNHKTTPAILTQIVNEPAISFPKKLLIPIIGVDANIQYLDINSRGEMEIPSNSFDVGWFKSGFRPGEMGSAVIAGHFNGENDEMGVFANLNKLQKGDKLYIENDVGTSIVFMVQEKRIYNSGYADEVFSQNDKARLNLVTCDGVWDGVKKSYDKRLVIFAY